MYALQFHIEVTLAIALDWLASEQGVDYPAVTSASGRVYEPSVNEQGNFTSFFFRDSRCPRQGPPGIDRGGREHVFPKVLNLIIIDNRNVIEYNY